MKQHITREQWDELSDDREVTIDVLGMKNYLSYKMTAGMNFTPSIGQLIEFLGDDLEEINNSPYDKVYTVVYQTAIAYHKKELIDALWEAVKYKLNN